MQSVSFFYFKVLFLSYCQAGVEKKIDLRIQPAVKTLGM